MSTSEPPSSTRDTLAFNLALLDRQMNFFPRIDAKALALFAVDVGLTSVVALNFPYEAVGVWRWWLGIVAASLASLSLFHLWWVFIPRLKSAARHSLLYFGNIASMEEVSYVKTLGAATDQTLADDAAHQVWRNAEILMSKYRHLGWATKFTAIAVIPWLGFLVAVAVVGKKLTLSL